MCVLMPLSIVGCVDIVATPNVVVFHLKKVSPALFKTKWCPWFWHTWPDIITGILFHCNIVTSTKQNRGKNRTPCFLSHTCPINWVTALIFQFFQQAKKWHLFSVTMDRNHLPKLEVMPAIILVTVCKLMSLFDCHLKCMSLEVGDLSIIWNSEFVSWIDALWFEKFNNSCPGQVLTLNVVSNQNLLSVKDYSLETFKGLWGFF